MIKLSSLTYILFSLTLFWKAVKGDYPVIIDDPSIKFSPRLYGRSTVVYNNKMYVYGGRAMTSPALTNEMYVYDFETDPNAARMSRVNQTNKGPACAFCGAVMIDKARMMILTKELYVEDYPELANDTIVRPFIFDFENLTWSVDYREPIYDQSLKDVFQIRFKHSTILGDDGMIYTIGGVSIFHMKQFQGTSWYYNPTDNSYHTVNNYNGGVYNSTGQITFRLSDTTIGSMYGRDNFGVYYPRDTIRVLDISQKSWIEPRKLTLVNYTNNRGFEDATGQVFSNNEKVYIFGGEYSINGTVYIVDGATELDLAKNTSTKLKKNPNTYYTTPRVGGSSAIISRKYFVTGFGLVSKREIKGLDVLRLPEKTEGYSETLTSEDISIKYEWVTSMSGNSSSVGSKKGLSTPTILFIVFIILAAICIGFIMLAVINRKKLSGKSEFSKRDIYIYGFFQMIWPRSIINSPVSSTESSVDIENVTYPDVRVCYSGWNYDGIFDTGVGTFPKLNCQNMNALSADYGCGEITRLDRQTVSPSFAGQRDDTKCYLYKSSPDSSVATKDSPTIQLHHSGSFTSKNQFVYIQFYEPEKDPNRVVYLNESLFGFDTDTVDEWLDSERVSGSKNDVMNQVLTVYPDSYIFVQFETTHTIKIDPDNSWNAFGIFPKYQYTSELSITHTDVMNHDTFLTRSPNQTFDFLGIIELSPTSFKRRTITEKRDVTLISSLGVFSGIVSMLLAIQVLLFGARPTNPWGIFQKASIREYQKQKKKEELKKYFYIPQIESVPFVTPVHQRFSDLYNSNSQQMIERRHSMQKESEVELLNRKYYSDVSCNFGNENLENSSVYDLNDIGTRLSQLEGRNQILELVLKAYYIDDKIFQELYSSPSNEKKATVMQRGDSGKVV